MYIKIIFCFFISLLYIQISGVDFLINQGGLYKLGDFLNSSTNSGTIISITASNVTLDLNNYIVQQINNATQVDGITIAAGLSNITIMNGTIANTSQNGVVIQSGCSNIYLKNLIIQNCAVKGISATGFTNLQITDCIINGCAFNNPVSGTGPYGIELAGNGIQGFLKRLILKNLGNSANNLTGIYIDSTICEFSNIIIENCLSNNFNGFELASNRGACCFKNCYVQSSTSQITFNAFQLDGSNNSNIFEKCICMNNQVTNTTTSGTLIGFNLSSSNQNLFKNCVLHSNTATNIYNFNSNLSHQNILIDCIAQNNTSINSTNGSFIGLDIANSTAWVAQRYVCSNNSSTGTSAGVIAISMNNWVFQDCVFSRQIGQTDAKSFGVRILDSGTTSNNNMFTRTIAFNNGATAANQLSGIVANSQQQFTSITMNSFTLPWTNLAIAS